ncbi:MAG TPA: class I adenylate-forming enzyme family protein, partial [Gemmatimonadaceae bacterium]
MSLFRLLERHLARGADRPLLVTADGTLSSQDVARESAKLAAWLRTAGTARGDRVVIDLKSGPDAVAALFGAARVGAIAVAASPQWMPQQIEHVIANSGARVLITSELRVQQLAGRTPPHVLVRGRGPGHGVTLWDTLVETWDDAVGG